MTIWYIQITESQTCNAWYKEFDSIQSTSKPVFDSIESNTFNSGNLGLIQIKSFHQFGTD